MYNLLKDVEARRARTAPTLWGDSCPTDAERRRFSMSFNFRVSFNFGRHHVPSQFPASLDEARRSIGTLRPLQIWPSSFLLNQEAESRQSVPSALWILCGTSSRFLHVSCRSSGDGDNLRVEREIVDAHFVRVPVGTPAAPAPWIRHARAARFAGRERSLRGISGKRVIDDRELTM